MDKFLTLMRREWLQYRFGWALMVAVPLGIALLLLAFGEIQVGADDAERVGDKMAPLLAVAAMAGSATTLFVIACFSSIIIVAGMARRDHSDRSVEFWLSLPATHSASLAAPLVVHLLLVPAAALLAGLAGGLLVSMVLVTRVVGIGEWFALPWLDLLPAILALAARLLAGLPLAILWMSPLILLVVLLSAWFRSWSWVILGVGIGLGSQLLNRVFGQPFLSDVTLGLLRQARAALVHAGQSFEMSKDQGSEGLRQLPAWALNDFFLAVKELPSPLLLGGLLFAAGCFYLLVMWRERGAGAAG
jgi:ABC-2 type transport system permease protein